MLNTAADLNEAVELVETILNEVIDMIKNIYVNFKEIFSESEKLFLL